MSKIVWIENGDGRLAHVGEDRHRGVYLGYVSDHGDGKGWRYEFFVDRQFGEREHFVGSRQAGMDAIRRRWKSFLRRAGLEPRQ